MQAQTFNTSSQAYSRPATCKFISSSSICACRNRAAYVRGCNSDMASIAASTELGLRGRLLVAIACAAVGTALGTLALLADACKGYSKAGWPGLLNGTLKGESCK
jgi:hypothetical protein